MVARVHAVHIGPDPRPEIRQPLHGLQIGLVLPGLRGEDHPALLEQLGEAGVGTGLLGAGDRVARNAEHAVGQCGGERIGHGALHRAHIRDRGARLQVRCCVHRGGAHGQHGHGQHHEVRSRHGLADVGGHQVGIAQLEDAGPVGGAGVGHAHLAHHPGRPSGQDHRGADQAAAHNGHTRIDHLAHGAQPFMKADSASKTARLCSSRPMVTRRWLGRP